MTKKLQEQDYIHLRYQDVFMDETLLRMDLDG